MKRRTIENWKIGRMFGVHVIAGWVDGEFRHFLLRCWNGYLDREGERRGQFFVSTGRRWVEEVLNEGFGYDQLGIHLMDDDISVDARVERLLPCTCPNYRRAFGHLSTCAIFLRPRVKMELMTVEFEALTRAARAADVAASCAGAETRKTIVNAILALRVIPL